MRHHAFTTRYRGRTRVIFSKVGVCLPLTKQEAENGSVKLKDYTAIWDTGATNSCITKKVAADLNLQPTGIAEVRHADGKSSVNTYLVNISLPNKIMVGQVRVTEVQLISDANIPDDNQPQLLIGMDIIGMGDFAVTHANGNSAFSFRIPSVEEIDFVPESDDNNIRETGVNRHQRRAMKAKLRRGY